MRDLLIVELIKELLGPRFGAEEVLKSENADVVDFNPSKEYVVGIIEPTSIWDENITEDINSPDSELEVTDSSDAEEDQVDDLITPIEDKLNPRKKPNSFGISFLVSKPNPKLKICVTWGRYVGKMSNKNVVWKRIPNLKIITVELNDKLQKYTLYSESDGKISLHVKKQTIHDSQYLISVFLENNLDFSFFKKNYPRDYSKTASSVFQPSIRINFLENDCIDKNQIKYDSDLMFLYRNHVSKGKGHMCSIIWKEIDYMRFFSQYRDILWPDGVHYKDECLEFMEPDVRTEFLPLCAIAAPDFNWKQHYGKNPTFSTSKLSEMYTADLVDKYLKPLVLGYERWIIDNETKLNDMQDYEREIASRIIETQKVQLNRLKLGLSLLEKDEDVRLSFCFANKAIWLQNIWKNGIDHPHSMESKLDFQWRPFQLAFILLNIPSVCDENHDDRNIIDLLWVPTGAGKTEAYLGLIAFTLALRRRKAIKGFYDEKTGGGTAVVTRYTLRLLTVQQFRRSLRLIQACEYLRVYTNQNGTKGWVPKTCSISDEFIYGSMRFSIGMWVGAKIAPNVLGTGYGAISILSGHSTTTEGEPAQIIRCPACNSWVSIPNNGLPAGPQQLFFLIKSNLNDGTLKNKMMDKINLLQLFGSLTPTDIKIHHNKLKEDFAIVEINVNVSRNISSEDIDNFFSILEKEGLLSVESLRASRPGYVGKIIEPGRKSGTPSDFDIWCMNPSCSLNNVDEWVEGVPLPVENEDEESHKYGDGLYKQNYDTPFLNGTRIPIVAYTVDEQIYFRCPSVIVSTVDKIARMAYEPRIANIFGNVTRYNRYYGYFRDDLFPKSTTKSAVRSCHNISIGPFRPPDLIIQDELHLIGGPLGSMFGLFEVVLDALIKRFDTNPKYIASTATISNASEQTKILFNKDLKLFPAYGLTIDDNFFVSHKSGEELWAKDKPGRIYMGVYAPALGSLTPLTRIYARLLQTVYQSINQYRDYSKYFWTVVGYFNTIKELGSGESLFKEDIIERIGHISNNINKRPLKLESLIELSSRVDSTDIPQILESLEKEGLNSDCTKNTSVILTTSMFGTGVDLPHLSLMVMTGQPKTHSAYIQATGRVGRDKSGLVISYMKTGRIRDLSHYELFPSYHYRLHLEVEPISVSPFASGTLRKILGPVIVSILRNMVNPSIPWYQNEANVITDSKAYDDIEFVKHMILNRYISIYGNDVSKIRTFLDGTIDRWAHYAYKLKDQLVFYEDCTFKDPEKNVVLGDSIHETNRKLVVYSNSPQSLRDVEDTIGFQI